MRNKGGEKWKEVFLNALSLTGNDEECEHKPRDPQQESTGKNACFHQNRSERFTDPWEKNDLPPCRDKMMQQKQGT
jgi:hypothetical protein